MAGTGGRPDHAERVGSGRYASASGPKSDPPHGKAPAVCETPPTAIEFGSHGRPVRRQGRAREKQRSREEDDRSLARGEKSVQQLKRECGYFAFPRVRMSARGSKPLE
jgi:hypothetical protein